ncbi:MAG: DUF4157 domain-containing protein, partial [Saprospiraceae bacterium]|nr:DUF4157 domain-containing protein [Saprospiraceae bacterium]
MQKAEATKTTAVVQQKPEPARPFFAPVVGHGNAVASGTPVVIQPKLKVNAPDDAHEREADAMAERVMRMPQRGENTLISGAGPIVIQRRCDCAEEPEVQRQEMNEEEETVQTKSMIHPASDGGFAASHQLASQIKSSKGMGKPLSGKTLTSMNWAFGANFSHVRIHTGSQASEFSQGLRARAFTYGSDIYFNHGQYNPESSEGKRLLAHELAHVMQQGPRSIISNEKEINNGPQLLPSIQRNLLDSTTEQEILNHPIPGKITVGISSGFVFTPSDNNAQYVPGVYIYVQAYAAAISYLAGSAYTPSLVK